MDEKPSVSAFQNFLQIENRLNIKKVMGRNVQMRVISRFWHIYGCGNVLGDMIWSYNKAEL